MWPSALTLTLAVAAAVLVLFTLDTSDLTSFRLSIIGYALGAIAVPIGHAVHGYLREEAKGPYYDPRYRYELVVKTGLAIGLLASVWHAFVVATELAR